MFGSISNKRPREEHDHTLLNLDGDSIREQKVNPTLYTLTNKEQYNNIEIYRDPELYHSAPPPTTPKTTNTNTPFPS